VKRMKSISFQMSSSDILELDSLLYVPDLTKSLLSISCMTDLQSLTKIDGQQATIRIAAMDLIEFWPKECNKVAFTGYLQT
jgi:hypothetical protein